MPKGGFAITIQTLLARRRSSITSKAMVGRFMSKVAQVNGCYDDEDSEVLKHKVKGGKKEYDEHGEAECWVPHNRTGIYYPKGHEWVMEDVPEGAACFAYSYWLRNSDSDGLMTSASKLFHNRRIRFGVHHNSVDDRESDSSPAEGNSSRHITTNRRHHHHTNRRNLEGCNAPPRRIHRHRLSELVQLEPSSSQSSSGSIINSEDFRNIRRWGSTENDRLPGVVSLARERLLERLRGVHISENRQNSRSSSSFHEDDMYNSYSSFIDKKLSPGLSQDALNSLMIKVYKNGEESNGSPNASRECSTYLSRRF
ncbi:hypothetical protein LXL04_001515 [Taraxacum kok-saghyz]